MLLGVRNLNFFLMLLSCCRVHPLQDGAYALKATRVLRDDCSLNGTGLVPQATLTTTGNVVRLQLKQPATTLMGNYLNGLEKMSLDGTFANFATTVRGRTCQVDVATFHLEGTTLSPSAFQGTLAIDYDGRQSDQCVCQFWYDFDAVLE
jgi:hypothetical protein